VRVGLSEPVYLITRRDGDRDGSDCRDGGQRHQAPKAAARVLSAGRHVAGDRRALLEQGERRRYRSS